MSEDQYDTDGLYEVDELRSRLGNVLLMSAVIVACVILLSIIWKACFSSSDEAAQKALYNQPKPQAVYMHEVQPGFVVLQSQDGQFFRLLQEYSEAKWKACSQADDHVPRSADRAPKWNSNSSSPWRPIEEVESIVYTPHYTSAHYQTQPSAPLPHLVSPLPLPPRSAMSDYELIQFHQADVNAAPPPYEQQR